MAKQAKKLASFRLPLEVVFSIQEMADVLSVSQSNVVEQAVVLFELRQSGVASEPRSPVAAIQSPSELQAMIDAKQGHKSVVGTFACRCVHSGCEGAKFVGASKFANICLACEEGGHRGDRRDCGRCADSGTGAL